MSKVKIIDEEGTQFAISLLRYAMAVNNKSFVLYTIGAMLVGGVLTLWLMFLVVLGSQL